MDFFGEKVPAVHDIRLSFTAIAWDDCAEPIVPHQPDIETKRIGYLGAACSIEDFKTALFRI